MHFVKLQLLSIWKFLLINENSVNLNSNKNLFETLSCMIWDLLFFVVTDNFYVDVYYSFFDS